MKKIQEFTQTISENIENVIVGKPKAIKLTITSLLCRGHLLIEDVPGTGKTMLAQSLAISSEASFKRIQFTPDMLPSDITGVSIYNQTSKQFEYRPGPIMSSFVLADEINRATPKTQSALLESMQEQQVTVDGITHPLPPLFMVLATQNPLGHEGTFNLPETQLDRFLMRISLGYPKLDDEIAMVDSQQFVHPIKNLKPVVIAEQILQAQEAIQSVFLAPAVKKYIVKIVRQTRIHQDIHLGASPRGTLGLIRASQAWAALHGREYVLPDDAKALAVPVLGHRIRLKPGANLQNLNPNDILQDILDTLAPPGGPFSGQ
jgi:MoxR-like ATPase